MEKVETRPLRPLSPHLQIFRRYSNMVMSILHRITGAANYFGFVFVVIWLIAAAAGPESFNVVTGFFASPLGMLLLFGYSWSLIHHALGGIRHFIWDTGRGFDVETVRILSWGTIVLSLTITGMIWGLGVAFGAIKFTGL